MSSTAVVLGAGLMGRLLAWQLARNGHSVDLYDAGGPDAQGSAARVAACKPSTCVSSGAAARANHLANASALFSGSCSAA